MVFKRKNQHGNQSGKPEDSDNNMYGDTQRNNNSMADDKVKQAQKLVKRVVCGIVLGFIVVFLAIGSIYTISEQEQAVLVTLGKPKAVTTSGLHFKIPLVQSVHKVNTTIQGFAIGYDQATGETTDEGIMITNDYNFVDVDFYCEYRVSDPVDYLYNSREPEEILRNISQSCIRTVISAYDVDSVLTTGKNEIQSNIKQQIMKKLEDNAVGIQLVNITIQDAEPPTTEVMQAFKAVETAKQGKETAINNANKYRNEKLPAAKAQVDQIIQNAEATKQQRINEGEAQVARFKAMYEEYQKNPIVTKQRMFYETMEDVLPDLKLIIDEGNGVQKLLPLEQFSNVDFTKRVTDDATNTATDNN